MDWDSYRYFLALSRRGNLKTASRDLKVNQTTVGRRIISLEQQIGTKLFEKRSNGFYLSAAGDRVLELAEQIEGHFLAMERQLLGKDQRLSGCVRIAMPGGLAQFFVIPRLGNFVEAHPQIELQFLTGPEVLNLSRREADMAIRLVRPQQTELVVRRLGTFRLEYYVAKSKSKKWNSLQGENREIPFIGLYDRAISKNEQALLHKKKLPFNTVLRSAAWSSVYSAVKSGLGIGILPSFIGASDPQLDSFNSEFETVPLWLVVHPEVTKSARVRAVIEYLADEFKVIR